MATKVLILSSGQCGWGQCLFCGWGKKTAKTDFEALKKKVNYELIPGLDTLKVFSSGSFFDDRQFTPEFREWFAKKCRDFKIKEVILESRPEFITESNIDQFKDLNLTVAIGLEVADDSVLKKLKKGFEISDFEIAAELLKMKGCKVRAYLLVNPPLVKDVQKIVDKSVEYALKWADSIVLINTFPHSESAIFDLWLDGKWNPLDPEEFDKVISKWKDNPKIEADFENWAFVPKFPRHKQIFLKGVGEEFLNHRYYQIWQDYLTRIYQPPENRDILLFLPCAFRKPYSQSKLHRRIIKSLRQVPESRRIHHVMISSPGVIPREFEKYYPFANYDWPEWEETPEIKKRYIEVTAKRIENFLRKHYGHYKKLFYYLRPDSESAEALKIACEVLGIEAINCVNSDRFEKFKETFKKNPLAEEIFLGDLKKTISENLTSL
jgi:archaeosine synthase